MMFLGTVRTGVVPVPVGFMNTEKNFRHFAADGYAQVMVAEADVVERLRAALNDQRVAPGGCARGRRGRRGGRGTPLSRSWPSSLASSTRRIPAGTIWRSGSQGDKSRALPDPVVEPTASPALPAPETHTFIDPHKALAFDCLFSYGARHRGGKRETMSVMTEESLLERIRSRDSYRRGPAPGDGD